LRPFQVTLFTSPSSSSLVSSKIGRKRVETTPPPPFPLPLLLFLSVHPPPHLPSPPYPPPPPPSPSPSLFFSPISRKRIHGATCPLPSPFLFLSSFSGGHEKLIEMKCIRFGFSPFFRLHGREETAQFFAFLLFPLLGLQDDATLQPHNNSADFFFFFKRAGGRHSDVFLSFPSFCFQCGSLRIRCQPSAVSVPFSPFFF